MDFFLDTQNSMLFIKLGRRKQLIKDIEDNPDLRVLIILVLMFWFLYPIPNKIVSCLLSFLLLYWVCLCKVIKWHTEHKITKWFHKAFPWWNELSSAWICKIRAKSIVHSNHYFINIFTLSNMLIIDIEIIKN